MATAAVVPTVDASPNAGADDEGVLIDTQHEDLVHDVQLDYYGAKMATCSSDRTIKICSLASNGSYEMSATLQGHAGPVWQVSWAHPKFGVVLASCGFDGSVLIHGETRPREWTILHAAHQLHTSSVNSVAFGPAEFGILQCAAASSDGRVSVLRHEPTTQIWTIEFLEDCPMGVNAVSWAPAGAYYDANAAAASNQNANATTTEGDAGTTATGTTSVAAGSTVTQEAPRLVTAGCDNGLRFWQCNTTTGEWTQQNVPQTSTESPYIHKDWVRDVAWAPSLVPNNNRIASCGEDGQVLIWTQPNGPESAWTATLLHQFDEPVWRVSWSATGHVLAVSSGDATVTLWKEGLPDGTWQRMDQEDAAAAPPEEPTPETTAPPVVEQQQQQQAPPPQLGQLQAPPTDVATDASSTAPAPPPRAPPMGKSSRLPVPPPPVMK